jgi:hypothetical protein
MAAQIWICSAHAYAPHEAISACTKSAEEPMLGAVSHFRASAGRWW